MQIKIGKSVLFPLMRLMLVKSISTFLNHKVPFIWHPVVTEAERYDGCAHRLYTFQTLKSKTSIVWEQRSGDWAIPPQQFFPNGYWCVSSVSQSVPGPWREMSFLLVEHTIQFCLWPLMTWCNLAKFWGDLRYEDTKTWASGYSSPTMTCLAVRTTAWFP